MVPYGRSGEMDEKGYVKIAGRIKDVIERDGDQDISGPGGGCHIPPGRDIPGAGVRFPPILKRGRRWPPG